MVEIKMCVGYHEKYLLPDALKPGFPSSVGILTISNVRMLYLIMQAYPYFDVGKVEFQKGFNGNFYLLFQDLSLNAFLMLLDSGVLNIDTGFAAKIQN